MRIAIKNNSLKRDVVLFRVMQEMREEMERVWKDFFEKNPEEKKEVVGRWLEERLKSMRISHDQDKGVLIIVQNVLGKLRSEIRQ